MDADTVLRMRPELDGYLAEFDGCCGRSQTRGHLRDYVMGQVSDLKRKSVEPMADLAGTAPRSLLQFLSLLKWDEAAARDTLQRRVACLHACRDAVGVIDDTSFVKKGRKTACVQRQHCGTLGKVENCVVSVHLGYVTPGRGGLCALLDGELFLPEHTWHADRGRCEEAGVPDDIVHRPKWEIALGQWRRAIANGVRFRWMTFDSGYGSKPELLRELDRAGQDYVAQVPKGTHVWTSEPALLRRAHARDAGPAPGPGSSDGSSDGEASGGKRGRPRKYPRLKVKSNPSVAVENVLRHSPRMREEPWTPYLVRDDGSKGPIVWEARRITVWVKDAGGLPYPSGTPGGETSGGGGKPHALLAVRHALEPGEPKFFLSNAPPSTPTSTLLAVALTRERVERLFEDAKQEVGMDHFEVRGHGAISRHLIVSCVSLLFLAEFRKEHGGGKEPGPDGEPGRQGGRGAGAAVAWRGALHAGAGGADQPAAAPHPGPQRRGGKAASQADPAPPARQGHHPEVADPLQAGGVLAV